MNTNQMPSYHATTDLACDAMTNEGGAIRQPSMHDRAVVPARMQYDLGWYQLLRSPITVFCASFAASLVIMLLKHHSDEKR